MVAKKGTAVGAAKKPAKKSSALPAATRRNVVPDRIDLRDRAYQPPVGTVPAPEKLPMRGIPVLNQRDTDACTGFSLATVVYCLQRQAGRPAGECRVSPFMLYSMARRYDEYPGDPLADTGSSVRGAMKGWYKHGASASRLWPTIEMPTGPVKNTSDDWWLDAVRRPLGAYYRVDTRSVTDMQVALNDVGVLYVSAACHDGWDGGNDLTPAQKRKTGYWEIPAQKAKPTDGGHAFCIVGYTRAGFIIQNSWDTDWATGGRAILTYQDWLDNAMDCWVAQLGVVTDLRMEIAQSPTLRTQNGKVQLASETRLRQREISPFVIDMENNGTLSNTGEFRTNESDVTSLVTEHLAAARERWSLGPNTPIDIAIYAHGGLVSEDAAAETAAKWIPAMYDRKIFPIFLMWETDLWSTLKNRVADVFEGEPRLAGGAMDSLRTWYNERLEKLLAKVGTTVWGEMKQNAQCIAARSDSGGNILYRAVQSAPLLADKKKVRLHLVGHSAGAIAHSYIINALGARDWTFESVNFLAPAVRVDTFKETVVPALRSGVVKQYNQFHLTDDMELKDPTCKPILGYGRSLLYLVSQSFEKGETTPILGMEKYFKSEIATLRLKNVTAYPSPESATQSTTHGGFDDDAATMNSVLSLIKGKLP